MSSICGQLPRKTRSLKSIPYLQAISGRVAVLIWCSLLAATAGAQHRVPLTLAAAEELALNQEPGQTEMLARAEALEEESVAAGQLPDPMLRVGLANFPLQSGGFTTEGMTQAQLGFRQAFPPGETRAASTRQFQSLALEMRQRADGRGRDVLSSVRQAWLETYYWQRAHAIVDQSRPFFADLVVVTRSMYSVGRKDQQDLLRAELELSRIDDRLIDINKKHERAIAALSEWIGADARRPIVETLPAWQPVPTLEMLQSNLLSHPVLQAADARIDAQQARVDIAEERYKPGWAMDLGYGYRDGYLPNGAPRSDFVSLSFTMDLPVFRKNRQDRKLAAALSQRRAANDSKEQLYRRLNSRLEAEYAQIIDLERRIELYERQILSLAEAYAQAALVAYQSDTGDFADVMRGYIDDVNTRVDHIRLQVERAQSYTTLANLGGIPR
jgi:outer membrane protein TolC